MSTEAASENVIFIGKKSVMNYVLAVLLQFDVGNKVVVLRARGRAISKAVDVAQIVKRRLLGGRVEVTSCKIDTEDVGDPPRKVSTIEIVLEQVE
ncbi:TPA: DNA-binding protein Alba [Candidatus Geothermarchaeota archaeon]|nr:DNA-binding protein Alba [Candidatus Geothermarchaeota archaeon]